MEISFRSILAVPRRWDLPGWMNGNFTDVYFNIGAVFGWIVGGTVFVGTWIAAIAAFWILGIPFGWIPAAVMARMAFYVAAWLWGVASLAVITLAIACTIPSQHDSQGTFRTSSDRVVEAPPMSKP